MSDAWSFSLYEPAALPRAFGKGNPRVLAELRTLVQADEESFATEDLPVLGQLATRLVEQGLTYQGLSPHEAGLVDALVQFCFAPNGLGGLEVQPLSPDHVRLSVLEDVAALAPGPLREALAPLRAGGRRADGTPGRCDYALLSPEECATLADGLRRLRESSPRWPDAREEQLVRECLEEPLATAARERLPVFARLS
jgi:hypothetical protein